MSFAAFITHHPGRIRIQHRLAIHEQEAVLVVSINSSTCACHQQYDESGAT